VDHALATRIVDFVSGLFLGPLRDMERLLSRHSDRAWRAAILTHMNGLTDEGFFNQALA